VGGGRRGENVGGGSLITRTLPNPPTPPPLNHALTPTLSAAAFSAQAVSPPFTDFFTRSTPALLRRPTENCYRLLSSGFLHGSVSHILMNTYSLTQIGPEVGEKRGQGRLRRAKRSRHENESCVSNLAPPPPPPLRVLFQSP